MAKLEEKKKKVVEPEFSKLSHLLKGEMANSVMLNKFGNTPQTARYSNKPEGSNNT